MTAQELYEQLKDAADYLGAGFDQIQVLTVPEGLRLSHGGREVIVHLAKETHYFPIMRHPDIKVPWSLIAQHEAQAQANHGQSLERLAARGGLSCEEAAAVLEDRKWSRIVWPEGSVRTGDPAQVYLVELLGRLAST